MRRAALSGLERGLRLPGHCFVQVEIQHSELRILVASEGLPERFRLPAIGEGEGESAAEILRFILVQGVKERDELPLVGEGPLHRGQTIFTVSNHTVGCFQYT